jgi:hypothetical protein
MKRRHRMPAYSLTITGQQGRQIHGKVVHVARIMPGKVVVHFVTSTRLDSYRYEAVYTVFGRSVNGFYMPFAYEMVPMHSYLFKGTFERAKES